MRLTTVGQARGLQSPFSLLNGERWFTFRTVQRGQRRGMAFRDLDIAPPQARAMSVAITPLICSSLPTVSSKSICNTSSHASREGPPETRWQPGARSDMHAQYVSAIRYLKCTPSLLTLITVLCTDVLEEADALITQIKNHAVGGGTFHFCYTHTPGLCKFIHLSSTGVEVTIFSRAQPLKTRTPRSTSFTGLTLSSDCRKKETSRSSSN